MKCFTVCLYIETFQDNTKLTGYNRRILKTARALSEIFCFFVFLTDHDHAYGMERLLIHWSVVHHKLTLIKRLFQQPWRTKVVIVCGLKCTRFALKNVFPMRGSHESRQLQKMPLLCVFSFQRQHSNHFV